MTKQQLLQQILQHPKMALKLTGKHDSEGREIAWCLFHPDGGGKAPHAPDLRIGEKGYLCFACKAKGSLWDLARQLGIESNGRAKKREAGVWDYYTPDGLRKTFQKVRFETPQGKTYAYRRSAPENWQQCPQRASCPKQERHCRDGFIWSLEKKPCSPAPPPVLYNQPALALSPEETVFLPEGEKAVDALAGIGLLAVTNPHGAGEWRPEYSEALTGRKVVLLPDADKPGREHVYQKAGPALSAKVASLKVLDLYPERSDMSDVFDWIAERKAEDREARSIREGLEALAAEAPEWQPPEYVSAAPIGISSPAETNPGPPLLCQGYAGQARQVFFSPAEQEFSFLFSKAIPREGWLADWLTYADPLTEAPREFLLMTGLVAVARMLGNRVYLPAADGKLFPNIWVTILGPSSISGKSTAVGIASRLIDRAVPDLRAPDELTPERLVKFLADSPEALIVQPELGNFLAASAKDYMGGSLELLTKLYDYWPLYRRETMEKTAEVREPAISLLGASTVEWLTKHLRERDIRGGFVARMNFSYAQSGGKVIPWQPEHGDEMLGNRLVQGLREMYQLGHGSGVPSEGLEVKVSAEAHSLYEVWYRRWNQKVARGEEELLSRFFGRARDTVKKLAIIYQAAATQGVQIDEEVMRLACGMGDYFLAMAEHLLKEELTFSREEDDGKRFRRVLEKHRKNGLRPSDFLRLTGVKEVKRRDAALRNLAAADYAEMKEGRWYPKRG